MGIEQRETEQKAKAAVEDTKSSVGAARKLSAPNAISREGALLQGGTPHAGGKVDAPDYAATTAEALKIVEDGQRCQHSLSQQADSLCELFTKSTADDYRKAVDVMLQSGDSARDVILLLAELGARDEGLNGAERDAVNSATRCGVLHYLLSSYDQDTGEATSIQQRREACEQLAERIFKKAETAFKLVGVDRMEFWQSEECYSAVGMLKLYSSHVDRAGTGPAGLTEFTSCRLFSRSISVAPNMILGTSCVADLPTYEFAEWGACKLVVCRLAKGVDLSQISKFAQENAIRAIPKILVHAAEDKLVLQTLEDIAANTEIDRTVRQNAAKSYTQTLLCCNQHEILEQRNRFIQSLFAENRSLSSVVVEAAFSSESSSGQDFLAQIATGRRKFGAVIERGALGPLNGSEDSVRDYAVEALLSLSHAFPKRIRQPVNSDHLDALLDSELQRDVPRLEKLAILIKEICARGDRHLLTPLANGERASNLCSSIEAERRGIGHSKFDELFDILRSVLEQVRAPRSSFSTRPYYALFDKVCAGGRERQVSSLDPEVRPLLMRHFSTATRSDDGLIFYTLRKGTAPRDVIDAINNLMSNLYGNYLDLHNVTSGIEGYIEPLQEPLVGGGVIGVNGTSNMDKDQMTAHFAKSGMQLSPRLNTLICIALEYAFTASVPLQDRDELRDADGVLCAGPYRIEPIEDPDTNSRKNENLYALGMPIDSLH